ncbi:hypothetical protein M9435_006974 [Picochlorum sp. BPE23]|nr:hypothetical protein M9435_006974 [Picochlorum sp. BPE23]
MAKRYAASIRSAMAADQDLMLWTDKYAPQSRHDLAVRRNKVEELMCWLSTHADKLCILSGPAGCGKSAMVTALTAENGWEAIEYVSKVQMPWAECVRASHIHTQASHWYESKLDAYESFCAKAWMPVLGAHGKGRQHLILLDDVPTVVGSDQMRRMIEATMNLITRAPKVIVMVTEASSRDTEQQSSVPRDGWETASVPLALLSSLERFSPTKISLNAIPKTTIVKQLGIIAENEGVQGRITKSELQTIAEQSQGDLSSAILSLQFACAGKMMMSGVHENVGAKKRRRRAKQNAPDEQGTMQELLSHMLRDSSLSIFHGLGKLLYNKRCESNDDIAENHPSYLEEWMKRPRMDGFDPEDTVHASGLSGPSVTAFLHENILAFIDDAHIEDASQCLDQLCEADILAHRRDSTPYYGVEDDPDGSRGLSDLMASMVSSRGICFWNSHPAPRSWKPLKAPACFKVESSRRRNLDRLKRACSINRVLWGGSMDLTNHQAMASEMLPNIRVIAHRKSTETYQQPEQWERYWQGSVSVHINHDAPIQQQEDSHLTQMATPLQHVSKISMHEDDEDPIE